MQDRQLLPVAQLPLTYQMPLQGLKVSTNKIYAGQHWSKRKSFKDSVTSVAGYFCRPAQRIESYPVQIHYRFFFASQPLDTLNTAYIAKAVEDSLRSIGILENDDPAHVGKSILEVAQIDRKKRPKAARSSGPQRHAKDEDYLVITISPYERSTNEHTT